MAFILAEHDSVSEDIIQRKFIDPEIRMHYACHTFISIYCGIAIAELLQGMQQDFLSLDDSDNVCLSGGADGADFTWGECASPRGHSVIHFVFRGHHSKVPEDQKIVLTRDQLRDADPFLEDANKVLKRRFPGNSDFVNSLLRRNYYQVAWSHSLYAISEIGKDQLVKGGTAWAVVMFQNLHPEGKCFVFDQKKEQWFQWKGGWVPMISPPAPEGVWAGIGTRDLNHAGEQAIRSLMGELPK